MARNRPRITRLGMALGLVTVVSLSACSGGGGGSRSAPEPNAVTSGTVTARMSGGTFTLAGDGFLRWASASRLQHDRHTHERSLRVVVDDAHHDPDALRRRITTHGERQNRDPDKYSNTTTDADHDRLLHHPLPH